MSYNKFVRLQIKEKIKKERMMVVIYFTGDMKIGIEHIDKQHESLIEFVNKATALCASFPTSRQMQESLDFLGEYVVKHFGDEEELQQKYNYPRYKQHKEIHDEFVRTFKSMYAEFEKYGVSSSLTNALKNRVSSWVVTHIKIEDIKFGEHCAKVMQQNKTALG